MILQAPQLGLQRHPGSARLGDLPQAGRGLRGPGPTGPVRRGRGIGTPPW